METNKIEAKVPTIMFTIMFKYVRDYKLRVTFVIMGHWLFKGCIHTVISYKEKKMYLVPSLKTHIVGTK